MTPLQAKAIERVIGLIAEARALTYPHNYSPEIKKEIPPDSPLGIHLRNHMDKLSSSLTDANAWLVSLKEGT